MRKTARHTCLATAFLPFLAAAASAAPRRGESAAAPPLFAFLASSDEYNVDKPLPADRIGLYIRASKLIEPSSPTVDSSDDPSPPQDSVVWQQRYSLIRKDAWLKSNAAGFALFDKALKAPLRPRKMDSLFTGIDFRAAAVMRQLARELIADVHAREMRGDWGGAVQRRLDILQMGSDFGVSGVFSDTLTGIAIQAIGAYDTSGSTGKLTLPQAHAAADRLGQLYGRRLRLATALESEKKWVGKSWRDALASPQWRDERNEGELSPDQRAELLAVKPAVLMKQYDDEMDRQIKIVRLPYLKMQGKPAPEFKGLLKSMVFDYTQRSAFVFARSDAGNALWMTALALQAHKLERGEYPRTLRGLVPGFLPRVPVDPFSGLAPLRYHRTKDSYLLWSIGPDGVDDGGKPIPLDKSKKPRAASPAAPARLPGVFAESKGDFVAGKNQ